VFEENNTAYIVMEYITGCSLKYMLDKEGVLSEDKALKYIHQIGNALDFVHNKNIVHLDIKPSNILIDREDNARLIDFGVSKRYDLETDGSSTTTLTLSKGYASIEQYDDEGTMLFSPCPDIYSLGATLYNILTGVIPVESILRVTKSMPRPSTYNSHITHKTEQVILKAMEVKPEDRFQSIKEMLAALEAPVYDLSENSLTETHNTLKDENTEYVTAQRLDNQNEDDNTEITIPKDSRSYGSSRSRYRKSRKKKARRKVLLSILLILLLATGCYGVYYYLITPKSGTNSNGLRILPNNGGGNEQILQWQTYMQDNPDVPEPEPEPAEEPVNNNSTTTPTLPESTFTKNTTPQSTKQTPPTQQTQSPAAPSPTATKENNNSSQADNNTIPNDNLEYIALIASAKEKMNKNNYADAITDLENAQKIKSTAEITSLLMTCKDKDDERLTGERLNRYELFNSFGSLTIARNNISKMYGAIDKNGRERIPCRYVTTERHELGRAFFRNDGSYDVYNDKGELVGEGLQ